MNSEMKKYYQEIYRMFPIHRKKEKIYFSELKEQLIELANDKENCSYQDCVEEFGTPKEIVIAYYQMMNDGELLHELNKKRIIKNFIGFLMIIFIIGTGYFIYDLNRSFEAWKDNLPAYDQVEMEIIEE